MSNLTFDHYQKMAWDTAIYNNKGSNLEYVSLGLGGECGEIQEYLKKTLHRNQEIDSSYLKKELGDLLWYLAATSSECSFKFSEGVGPSVIMWDVPFDGSFYVYEEVIRKYSKVSPHSAGRIGIVLHQRVFRLQEALEVFQPGNRVPVYLIEPCLRLIVHLCILYNFNLEDIAFTNLEKLQGRKLRETLAGHGDDR